MRESRLFKIRTLPDGKLDEYWECMYSYEVKRELENLSNLISRIVKAGGSLSFVRSGFRPLVILYGPSGVGSHLYPLVFVTFWPEKLINRADLSKYTQNNSLTSFLARHRKKSLILSNL